MAQLRTQAELVPALMAPYGADAGYRLFFMQYYQIIETMARLQAHISLEAKSELVRINDEGWAALNYADRMLSRVSGEIAIAEERRGTCLQQVRELIDQIIGDYTLSPSERSRIVDLLRKVEQALLDVKINGWLPVQDAVAAAGAIVRMSLWERVKSRPWVRDFGAVMIGLFMGLEATANTLAIEQYFSAEPQKVIVIDHQAQQDRKDRQSGEDQHNGQEHPAHPTDQPTPR
jgi:hypothetical protein